MERFKYWNVYILIMTLKANTIYCGDNLAVLQGFEDNSVDLCYIDPPFFTSKQYEVIWKDGAEIRSFDDRWVKMAEGRYTKDINVYLNFMEPRLREIHRVLKQTGSFYLHCDWHADAYLRVLCDGIFGYENFRNGITWRRCHPKGNAKGMANNTDTIFYYTKSDAFCFKTIYSEYSEATLKMYQFDDKDCKGKYRAVAINAPGGSGYKYDLGLGEKCPESGYRWTETTMRQKISDGLVMIKSGNVPTQKRYLSESKGVPLDNLWDNIENVVGNESLGYPTQKPEALLERIIKASSNEGDVVLDCFAGCGTTLAVAQRLKRQFVGIDVSTDSCHVLAKRIGYPIADIVGMPFTAEEIATLTGYQFQNAVIRMLDPSSNTIKVNNRGADGGIDGSYFDLLISVKKYKAGRKDLDEFVATMYRNKKNEGVFIALEYSSDFTKEVARLGREQKITVYPFTLAEIIAEKHKSLTRKEDKAHGKL
jgi:DNA modification methylase